MAQLLVKAKAEVTARLDLEMYSNLQKSILVLGYHLAMNLQPAVCGQIFTDGPILYILGGLVINILFSC